MARYAIIKNGVVDNLVEADEAFAKAQGWIAASQSVRIKDLYVDNTFIRLAEPDGSKVVNAIRFKLLFTLDELVAIRVAAANDPKIAMLLELVNDSKTETVDMTMGIVTLGLDYLVSKGLITGTRKTEILAGHLK